LKAFTMKQHGVTAEAEKVQQSAKAPTGFVRVSRFQQDNRKSVILTLAGGKLSRVRATADTKEISAPKTGSDVSDAAAAAEEEWQPEHAATLALLEDADRLAAEGRFDEATRLLLQRSVGQMAAARPDWVEPSSTARELAALPALPEAARTAFRVIAEQVERSLFALRALERSDWEAARAAYADFALARLNVRQQLA
jgi:hypothetical protein